MKEWKKVKLKDITISITDGKHGDCKGQDNSGYYFISCKDVSDGTIHYENARQITKEDFIETDKRTNLATNDILITNSGTIGRMAFVKDIPETRKTTFQKSVAIVKPNTDKVLPIYLYYLLQSKVSEFVNSSNGAAQKNLLLSTMREFELSIEESFSIQQRIATILSRYDSLIENYQKQIKLLEESAQRLYKEWFIDLRFPGHENTKIVDGVPEGWEKKKAVDFFIMSIGKTPPRAEKEWFTISPSDVPWVSISDMKDIMFVNETNEHLTKEACEKFNVKIVPEGTILLSFKLTVGRVSIADIPVCTNEAIAHFRKDGTNWREYTLLYLRAFNYDSLGNTSGISKAVNSTIIKNMPFLLPPEILLNAFSDKVTSTFNNIRNLSSQIRHLTEARNRLLPKLMSGEIKV